MRSKKFETKFTIRFNQTDPSHREVADILNRQGWHGKGQYIVNAVLHYINCEKTLTAQINEKSIEAIVNRVLRDRKIVIDKSTVRQSETPPTHDEKISYSNDIETIGDGVSAITDALTMFRKK